MHQLNRLAALTAHLHCNGCADLCEGAVGNRVAIAEPLRFLMYHESYGKTEAARELYNALPRKARAFERVDLAAAAAVCPHGIDIAARLRQAKEALQA